MMHPATRLLPVFLVADDRPSLLERLANTLRSHFPDPQFLLTQDTEKTCVWPAKNSPLRPHRHLPNPPENWTDGR